MIEQHHTLSEDPVPAQLDTRTSLRATALENALALHQQQVFLLWFTRDPITHVTFPNAVDWNERAVMQCFTARPRNPVELVAMLDRFAVLAASGRAWLSAHLGGYATPSREDFAAKTPLHKIASLVHSIALFIEIDEAPRAELSIAHNTEEGALHPWFHTAPVPQPAPQSLLKRGAFARLPDEALRTMASAIMRTSDLIDAGNMPPAPMVS